MQIFSLLCCYLEKQAKPEMQEKRDAIIHSLILIFGGSLVILIIQILVQIGMKCGYPKWPEPPLPPVRINLLFHDPLPPWSMDLLIGSALIRDIV